MKYPLWQTPNLNTFTEGLQEFLSPVFSIIVVWALIQPEAEFLSVKERKVRRWGPKKSDITGQK